MVLAAEQRTLGRASLGNSCFSSELSLLLAHALGTASLLTSEPGLGQSSHPRPLTGAGVGGEQGRGAESLGARHSPTWSPPPCLGAVTVKFYASTWLGYGAWLLGHTLV